MAFKHNREQMGDENYLQHFKTNWPSPILFFDRSSDDPAHNHVAPAGADNHINISTKEFKVFYNEIYPQYKYYRQEMPDFRELHQMRKSAAESSRDDETQVLKTLQPFTAVFLLTQKYCKTQVDCLAFQGTIRTKQNGTIIDQINGSGHHGVDYIGVSSVRAGKGYKMSGGISQIVRQI